MRWFVLPLAVLGLAFAPAPLPRQDRRTDLEKLQGEWVTVSSVLEGGVQTFRPNEDRVVFKGDQLSFVIGGSVSARWTVRLGSAQKLRTLDLRGDRATDFILGIYQLEGDKLTICNRNMSGSTERPTDFVGRQGVWLHVYKRGKR
jgi:uncharacterized protein (TIGR03067 family)